MGKRQSEANGIPAGVLVRGFGAGVSRGRSKYGAKRATAGNKSFASMAERNRFIELDMLERGGVISGLICQPVYKFVINDQPLMIGKRAARYTPDFEYLNALTGKKVVEDVKGMMTRDAQIRIALMVNCFGIHVRIIKMR